jgi:hypothetical protein
MSFNTSQCTSFSTLLWVYCWNVLQLNPSESPPTLAGVAQWLWYAVWRKLLFQSRQTLHHAKNVQREATALTRSECKEMLHQDVSGQSSDCTTHTSLSPPILGKIKTRSIFKIYKFIHGHENGTLLFSSVQRTRV